MAKKSEILFVELEDWERGRLEQYCRHKCEIHSFSDHLDELPDDQLPAGVAILSPFIHSDCSAKALDRFENLQAICTRSTGFDHIDVDYCRRRGITVCNVPTYGDNTVAEHTFALILALTRKIHRCYERTVRGDFSLGGLRGIDLAGRTLGCVGAGNIGLNVLRIARGFNMNRLAFDVRTNEQAARELEFEYVDFDTMLARSDVLSLHVPHNPKTHHIINANALARLPDGAIVVNTARGGLIDPQALIESLKSGHLRGAALDVLEAESAIGEEAELLTRGYDLETLQSVVRSHALLQMPNVIITPHVAFNSAEAVERILSTTIENIDSILAGQPKNVVA